MAATQLMMKLGMDGKGFSSGVTKAKTQVKGLKNSITKSAKGMIKGFAAMVTVAVVADQIKKTIEWAAKIRDLATTFGITAEAVQKLEYAAEQSGLEVEVVMDAMKDLGKNTSEALMGVESKVWAFKQLGIDAATLKGLAPDQIFIRVANAIKGIPALQVNDYKAIEDLMGGAGFQSVVMFKNGVDELGESLVKLGGIVDTQTIEKIAAMDDKFAEFKTKNRQVWADITGGIINAWMTMVNLITSSIDYLAERLASLGSGMGEFFGGVWDMITINPFEGRSEANMDKARRAKARMKEGGRDLLHAAHGLTDLSDIGESMNRKDREADAAVARKKADRKREEINQKIGDALKTRLTHVKRIDDIEKAIADRKYSQLSPEQKLLAIQKKQREELEKMFKLQPTTGDVTTDPRVKGLKGLAEAEKLAQLEKEKADYLAQEQVLEGLDLDEAEMKKKIIADKSKGKQDMAGGIKETYSSLSRIGGQLGGKNPLISKAEEQLKVQKSSDLYLANISQVTTMTFGG